MFKTLLGQAYPNVTLFAELELEDGVQLWANGPYFAKANVGATEPKGSGYYFWWGDTVGYEQVGGKWVSVKDGSAIARQMAELYACGAYERIYVKVNPRVTVCYYRLKD